MNRVATLAALLVLTALVSLGVAAPTMHQGKVTGIAKGQLMILDTKDGETETFVVNDSTKVTVDMKPAKLVDIQVGYIAEVTAETNTDGKLIAKSIAASSKLSPE
jgi:hypothetical protein